jgi:predicted HTH domain antitoxin
MGRRRLKIRESTMATRAIKVNVEVPGGVSEQDRVVAEQRAREAVILSLWEANRLSTREAAEELGISYGDFLDLLAARSIPVERGELSLAAIRAASRRLASGAQ